MIRHSYIEVMIHRTQFAWSFLRVAWSPRSLGMNHSVISQARASSLHGHPVIIGSWLVHHRIISGIGEINTFSIFCGLSSVAIQGKPLRSSNFFMFLFAFSITQRNSACTTTWSYHNMQTLSAFTWKLVSRKLFNNSYPLTCKTRKLHKWTLNISLNFPINYSWYDDVMT